MLLLGDSHAMAIRSAANTHCIRLFGGQLDGGRNLNANFYRRTEGDVVFLDDKVEKLYRQYLAEAGVTRIADLNVPVLCLFGMNIHYLARRDVWGGFAVETNGSKQFLSRAVIAETARSMIPGAFNFYQDLVAMGLEVYSALPPRRPSVANPTSSPAVFVRLEDVLLEEVSNLGVRVIDHRSWSLDRNGRFKAKFMHPNPEDQIHAGERFGKRLLQQLAAYREATRPNGWRQRMVLPWLYALRDWTKPALRAPETGSSNDRARRSRYPVA